MIVLPPIIYGKYLNTKEGSGILACKCLRDGKAPYLVYVEDPHFLENCLVCTCAMDEHAVS